MTPTLVQRLTALKLLAKPWPGGAGLRLTALCDSGCLVGGLSAALDVRPEELVGPLVQQLGGIATKLKVLEVRDLPSSVELTVSWDEEIRIWPVRSLRALAAQMNQAFIDEEGVKTVLILGEFNDALQLWCVSRAQRVLLERETWFQTEPEEMDLE